MSDQDKPRFVEVAVDAPTAPGQTYSYSLPKGITAIPGQLVIVPFGTRRTQGLIFDVSHHTQIERIRPILEADEGSSVLTPVQLKLARWVSDYYLCSLFEAVTPMLPPGGRFKIKAYFKVASQSYNQIPITKYQQDILDFVIKYGTVEEELIRKFLGKNAPSSARHLEQLGFLTLNYARSKSPQTIKYQDYIQIPVGSSSQIKRNLDCLTMRAPKQKMALLYLVELASPMLLKEARTKFGKSAISALVRKGTIETISLPVDRDPLAGRSFPIAEEVKLTPQQHHATKLIDKAFINRSRRPPIFLLEGVTGSGKTEVYLKAVQRCIQQGRRAIVMVPEIALTPQTIERFASRFPGKVAVLHSGLTAGERFDLWWKIRQGDYKIVIGSRSAIFAPIQDIGLIVLDEEHEWTYKQQDTNPRYHARTVALRLSTLESGIVLLGSASPDIQSYRRALLGSVKLLRLPYRVSQEIRADGSPKARGLAPIQIVDMRQELNSGNRHMFSRVLQSSLSRSIEHDNQAILFLNRRGSSPYFQCRQCGSSIQCRRCDVSLTYHKDTRKMLCHYCGEQRTPPHSCPECNSHNLAFSGIGTKAVVEAINNLCPGIEVARWDRDSIRTSRNYESALDEFRSGRAQVLVGTQMIAKGLHFPSVDLVGVVLADLGLTVPDYRAGERTFQLLYQVAGRSGRGLKEGNVIIQTYQPQNYSIKAAAAQDYRSFYHEETAHRQEQGNPPFSQLIRLVYNHVNKAKAEIEALRIANLLLNLQDEWGISEIDILGPTPAFPERIRGRHRWQLVLRGPRPRELLDKIKLPREWTIDVDPATFG